MTDYDIVLQMCRLVSHEASVQDILNNAVRDGMVYDDEAGEIGREVGVDWDPDYDAKDLAYD
jgi:hypothetical protein